MLGFRRPSGPFGHQGRSRRQGGGAAAAAGRQRWRGGALRPAAATGATSAPLDSTAGATSRTLGAPRADLPRDLRSFGFRTNFSELYELGPLLGSGSFATVHVATHRQTGERFAVKTMPKRFIGEYLEPMFAARVRHEVDVYRVMGQSLNVAHLEAAFEDDVAVDLVLELCSGGTMWSRIRRGHYGERTAAAWVRDVLRAVAQCHAKGVLVRDVKPDNFLFLNDREDSPLKMIDFGLAQFCAPGDVMHDRAGTPFFVAPEVLKQNYSLPADVWSAGITAYQLLAGHFPWHNDPEIVAERARALEDDSRRTGRADDGQMRMSNKMLFRAILSSEFDYSWDPWPSISPEAKAFVQAMLVRDPAARPTAAQMLRHPWLARLEGGGAGAAAAADAPLADTLVQRLQRYGTYGRLKQIALREVAHLMLQDGDALQGLAGAFRKLDPEGTGRVPFGRAVEELRGGGYDLSESEIRTLLLQFDLDRDGSIDLAEWSAALMDWSIEEQRKEWEDWVHKVFDLFDSDHSQRISTEELAAVLCGGLLKAGNGGNGSGGNGADDELCVPDAVPAALRRVDTDGDGYVSFSEFLEMLHTSDAEALELFPSRRLPRGSKRAAAAAVEQRRRAGSAAGRAASPPQ